MTEIEADDKQSLLNQPNTSPMSELLALVGLSYFFLVLGDPQATGMLSIRFILKDHFHLTTTQMATFFAIIGFAWNCKPLAGLMTDNVPLFGTRRRGYLLVAGSIAAALWLYMAVAPITYRSMLCVLACLTVMLVIAQTTLGGLLVEAGQAFRATGRLSSTRNGAESSGSLIASLLGGWFAAHRVRLGYLCYAFTLLMLTAFVGRYLREKPAMRQGRALSSAYANLRGLFTSRTMLIASVFWMLVRFSPGFQTPLFVYQTETLKLKPEFLGVLGVLNGGAGLIAAFVYLWACRKAPLKHLLYIGVAFNVLAGMGYFAYHSALAAMVVESAYGFAVAMAFLPILDLLARSTPRGSEALGYALIFSFGNISLSLSDVSGSWLFDRLHHNFSSMIWLNTATSALVLVAIPCLPKMLISGRDGVAAN